ncbi:hypothetical protein [Paraburkholderia acidiphila]|uniref:Uncharacterized protein n=1 Tax=Paraburkholderia acidiphila TaxID=2571747 RepID=A0A7Z2G4M8_9BURK|nr:hypothetical protein [Paraburkholderia acidiphila]QGZ54724.1 hypothetical protein FAZ97_07215 [Paraburkholderia acidiphila]
MGPALHALKPLTPLRWRGGERLPLAIGHVLRQTREPERLRRLNPTDPDWREEA